MATRRFNRHCIHLVLDNGVHEIILNESSKAAVDEWFEIVEEIYAKAYPDDPIRLLIDVRAGMQPLAYMLQRARDFFRRHDDRPPSKTAMIHNRDFLVKLVRTAFHSLRTQRTDPVEFFPAEDRDHAMSWLLADN